MTHLDIFKQTMLAVFISVWMILDLALNSVLMPLLMLPWSLIQRDAGSAPSPYETLSARAGRGMLNQRPWPRYVTGPVIDFLFLWQRPYFDLPDGRRFEHPSHCVRAFVKTRHLVYLPSSYSGPLPPSLLDCYVIPTGEGKP